MVKNKKIQSTKKVVKNQVFISRLKQPRELPLDSSLGREFHNAGAEV